MGRDTTARLPWAAIWMGFRPSSVKQFRGPCTFTVALTPWTSRCSIHANSLAFWTAWEQCLPSVHMWGLLCRGQTNYKMRYYMKHKKKNQSSLSAKQDGSKATTHFSVFWNCTRLSSGFWKTWRKARILMHRRKLLSCLVQSRSPSLWFRFRWLVSYFPSLCHFVSFCKKSTVTCHRHVITLMT